MTPYFLYAVGSENTDGRLPFLGRSGGDIYKSTSIADCKECNRAPAVCENWEKQSTFISLIKGENNIFKTSKISNKKRCFAHRTFAPPQSRKIQPFVDK